MGDPLEKNKYVIYAAFLPCYAFVFNYEHIYVFLPPLNLENCTTDQASVENNNPAKRQRWNSEPVKGSNIQRSTVRPATAPMGEPISLKCNFSWSDSPAIDVAPKERIGKSTCILLGV